MERRGQLWTLDSGGEVENNCFAAEYETEKKGILCIGELNMY